MVKLNKIYTRTGDNGTTGLVDGSRAPKASARIAAIGAADEVNAALGFALLANADHGDDLRRTQNDLFDLGADLATPADADEDFAPSEMVLRIVPAQVEWLEAVIDRLNADLEPLTSFILPGGSEAAARLHLARTATRQAERQIAALADAEPVNPAALAYINRLSDYLFVLGRHVNAATGGDPLWVPGASR